MRKARGVHIVLTEEQDDALDRVSRIRGDSRSSVVRQLIRDHLEPTSIATMPRERI